MTLRTALARLVSLWLLASGAAFLYGWLNIVKIGTPVEVDTLFGACIILALILTKWMTQVAKLVSYKRAPRVAAFIWLGLAVFLGIAWAAGAAVEGVGYRPWPDWMTFLPRLISRISVDHVLDLRSSYRSGAGLPAVGLLKLVAGCLALGMAALITAVALRVAGLTLSPTLDRLQKSLRKWLARLPIRFGRCLTWLRRLGVVSAIVLLIVGVIAVAANDRIPDSKWQATGTALVTPPTVYEFLLDNRTGSLYAGTDNGVFRSDDKAMNWHRASSGLPPVEVYDLLLDAEKGLLYAATNSGLYQSTDNATSWQLVSGLPAEGFVSTLLLDDQSGILYVGSFGKVIRSLDRGASWQQTGIGLDNTTIFALTLDTETGTLYAGTYRGVLRSLDQGVTWQLAGSELENSYVPRLLLDQKHDTLYAGTGSGLYESSDGGDSWQLSSAELRYPGIRALARDERDGSIYVGTSLGIFFSRDNGATWHIANVGLTNTTISALTVDPENSTLYVGTYSGGVFRSTDGSNLWQPASSGFATFSVWGLVVDEQGGTLYAATPEGIFRSLDDGATWQESEGGVATVPARGLAIDQRNGTLYAAIGDALVRSRDRGSNWERICCTNLPDLMVDGVVVDPQQGRIYLLTDRGVLVSIDNGTTWQIMNNDLNTTVWDLVADTEEQAVFVATADGVLRGVSDGGGEWQATGSGLPDGTIVSLLLDESEHTLYASGSDGVYRSSDGGNTWTGMSEGLSKAQVVGLAIDKQSRTIYASTLQGIFVSNDEAVSWQAANRGMNSTYVLALVLAPQKGFIYAGTIGGGVFRSGDGARTWQTANTGLTNTAIRACAVNAQNGTQYVATSSGVFWRQDSSQDWQPASAGLISPDVSTIGWGGPDGTLFAFLTSGWAFESRDNAASWYQVRASALHAMLDLPRNLSAYGYAVRDQDGTLIWTSSDGGLFWTWVVARFDLRGASIHRLSEDRDEVWTVLDGRLARTELSSAHNRDPLVWLAFRALVWRVTIWLSTNWWWAVIALAAVVVMYLYLHYVRPVQRFGVPSSVALLRRQHLERFASPEDLRLAWATWEKSVRAELLRFGDVRRDDLLRVPNSFRHYVLGRYADIHAPAHMLEVETGQLRLQNHDRLRRWQNAWEAACNELGTKAGLTPVASQAVDDMAKVLAEALGFTLGAPRDFEAVRAFLVEAPSLRLKLPLRFPLVFVSDPCPGPQTVEMLVDAIDVLRESGYFGIVVPLQPLQPDVNVAMDLRAAVDQSAYVHDLIVLNEDSLVDLLMAQRPIPALVSCILAQVDLTVVAPFVISGPVPETMFFGREAEVKQLVESVGSASFAVVGNRKIGKTSVLRRAEARIVAGKRAQVWFVDCQTVRDSDQFFAEFQSQTGVSLSSRTCEAFRLAVDRRPGRSVPLVLIMDEVDALLIEEQKQGEPLAATWRAMAQADICDFVFCGSTGLARRLDDPDSVFFNFPQPLKLSYLAPKAARMVLAQPFETLGILLEDADQILNEAVALTSGHPNLVQYVGRELIHAVNRRGERRILLEDMAALRNSTDFMEYYLKTVWGEAGPLERLITLVAPASEFTTDGLETCLAASHVTVSDEELTSSLKLLQVYAILEKKERRYAFIPRAFTEILHRSQEVGRLVAAENRRLQKGDR